MEKTEDFKVLELQELVIKHNRGKKTHFIGSKEHDCQVPFVKSCSFRAIK